MSRQKTSQASRDRAKAICHALRQKGRMSVAEIQELLGVSDMTVRRCLNDMAAEGLLRRVHGGAAAVDASPANIAFNARTVENLEYKTALAREAVRHIPSGCSIYLDGGTTCYEISRHLPDDLKCFVVTDSIAILKELRGRAGIETILLGGQLAGDDNTVDGPLAAENAARMSVDLCMISVGSFTTRHLQNNVLSSMLTKQIMLESAKRAICVSDASKFNKSRFMRICEWEAISLFLTDDRLPQAARDAIAAQDVEVRIIGL
jgi:DeoR family fructose operon transcriptional repressor